MTFHQPALNACLNAVSAVLLVLGYLFIRRGRREAHQKCMISACFTSLLFLISYLTYHYFHGSTRYQGAGLLRNIYFSILISHTILAAVILPLILTTLFWAWKGTLDRHAKFARVTFPLWLYVSVTGVVIYWMLYRL
jgi:uncharacterized membrane protein YozB (DUF420 family)